MRFIISVILIILLAGAATYFLPWWLIAVVSFAVTLLLRLKPGAGFFAGFLGIAILWAGWALKADAANDHILSRKMGILFHLPNYTLFIIVATFIGALAGGLAGWSGALVRKMNS
ncbi:hypothetical protein ACTHGU_06785 [Chitinophagaceae bacterium MMS25-I14]